MFLFLYIYFLTYKQSLLSYLHVYLCKHVNIRTDFLTNLITYWYFSHLHGYVLIYVETHSYIYVFVYLIGSFYVLPYLPISLLIYWITDLLLQSRGTCGHFNGSDLNIKAVQYLIDCLLCLVNSQIVLHENKTSVKTPRCQFWQISREWVISSKTFLPLQPLLLKHVFFLPLTL